MAAKILKHERAEKFHFKNLIVKNLAWVSGVSGGKGEGEKRKREGAKGEEASSFNNIKWIGFYRLIKLRFCMGQNPGYFNKANQRYSFFNAVLKELPRK